MKSALKPFLVFIAAAAIIASGTFIVSAADENVKIQKGKLGNILVDAKGVTLYYYKKDSKGKSACAGDCVAKWPVFYVETVAPGKGLSAGDFGTITRDDGKTQTTFKGWPLYYFFQDQKPGDTKGQKVKDVWFVVNPAALK